MQYTTTSLVTIFAYRSGQEGFGPPLVNAAVNALPEVDNVLVAVAVLDHIAVPIVKEVDLLLPDTHKLHVLNPPDILEA